MHNAMGLFGALASGTLPQRIPVVCNLIDQGAIELGLGSREYYSSAENVAEGQLRLLQKYGHDVAWGAHYIARISEMLGASHTVFPEHGPPNVGAMVIQSWDDIEKLTVPVDICEHPSFKIQAETIRLLRQELGGQIPICAFQVGAFTLPTILMGICEWMTLLLSGPADLIGMMLTKCSDISIALLKGFRQAGADFVVYANPFASPDFLTLSQIENMGLPWIRRDLECAGCDQVIYFSGGARIAKTLPMLVEHTDIGVFYLNPFDDVSAAKNVVAGKALLAAPVNDILLIDRSRDAIRQSVRELVQAGAPGGGFILGTLMMPCQIPEANIHALIEAAHEFGAYNVEA
ncbi:MAG: uroporphyrinogen decarboxylase [Deltaproteobacteria bacterium]|nr:uroporphyrinogen decarboxylase [Deltaproteobacteria bacterium]